MSQERVTKINKNYVQFYAAEEIRVEKICECMNVENYEVPLLPLLSGV